jgi:hypothetical protein
VSPPATAAGRGRTAGTRRACLPHELVDSSIAEEVVDVDGGDARVGERGFAVARAQPEQLGHERRIPAERIELITGGIEPRQRLQEQHTRRVRWAGEDLEIAEAPDQPGRIAPR